MQPYECILFSNVTLQNSLVVFGYNIVIIYPHNAALCLVQRREEEDGHSDQHGKAGHSTPRQDPKGTVNWELAAYRTSMAIFAPFLIARSFPGLWNRYSHLTKSSNPHHGKDSEVYPARETVPVCAEAFSSFKP